MARERKTSSSVGGNAYRKSKGLRVVTVYLSPEDYRAVYHAAIDAGLRGVGPYLRNLGIKSAREHSEKYFPE